MKRRVRNVIRDALNDVVHGREVTTVKEVEETGTTVLVKRLGPQRVSLDLILRGDDRVEV